MKKVLIFIVFALISTSGLAFKCYITMMKSACWKDYNLHVNIKDAVTHKKIIATINLNKGELWKRKPFVCNPKQGLIYDVTYDPYIWESQKDKIYHTKRIWFLPAKIKPGVTAWNVPICFPKAFSDVPILPNVDKSCNCESVKTDIPPIPPQ